MTIRVNFFLFENLNLLQLKFGIFTKLLNSFSAALAAASSPQHVPISELKYPDHQTPLPTPTYYSDPTVTYYRHVLQSHTPQHPMIAQFHPFLHLSGLCFSIPYRHSLCILPLYQTAILYLVINYNKSLLSFMCVVDNLLIGSIGIKL